MVDVCHDGDIPEIHAAIVAVKCTDRENERLPSLEVEQVRRPQTQEEVLLQQATLQALPGGAAPGPQGRAQRAARQGADEGVQARPKVLIRFGRTRDRRWRARHSNILSIVSISRNCRRPLADFGQGERLPRQRGHRRSSPRRLCTTPRGSTTQHGGPARRHGGAGQSRADRPRLARIDAETLREIDVGVPVTRTSPRVRRSRRAHRPERPATPGLRAPTASSSIRRPSPSATRDGRSAAGHRRSG